MISMCIFMILLIRRKLLNTRQNLTDLDIIGKNESSQIYKKMITILIVILLISLTISGDILSKGKFNNEYKNKPEVIISTVGSDDMSYTIKVVETNQDIGIIGLPWAVKDNEGNILNQTFGALEDIYGLMVGNVSFHDNDEDGSLSSNDTFTVSKTLSDGTEIPNGFKLCLIWTPTSEELCFADLKG